MNKIQLIPIFILIFLLVLLISFFDKGAAVGLSLIAFLTAATILILYKFGLRDKQIYFIFLFFILIHLLAVLFIYYFKFQPFSGGSDADGYNGTAIMVAERLSQGNFSINGLSLPSRFPILVGVLYFLTMPAMIVGQSFMVWASAISILLAYFLILEIGGSKKSAILVSVITCFYPSYLLFGSLLLKDNLVTPLLLAGILLLVKMLKDSKTWKSLIWKFLLFFIISIFLMHFRFYMGFALIFSFIISWFIVSCFDYKKRIIYGLVMVVLLGFCPQIVGGGYYGQNLFNDFFNKETITNYREVAYKPTTPIVTPAPIPTTTVPTTTTKVADKKPQDQVNPVASTAGTDSSFVLPTGFDSPVHFIVNYATSFVYAFLGPFPWQISQKRHALFLLDTIPWYLFLLLILLGVYDKIRKHSFKLFLSAYRFTLPLILYSLMAIGALSLFINNFGIIARIRMPVFMMILCLLCFNEYFDNFAKKILNYVWHNRDI